MFQLFVKNWFHLDLLRFLILWLQIVDLWFIDVDAFLQLKSRKIAPLVIFFFLRISWPTFFFSFDCMTCFFLLLRYLRVVSVVRGIGRHIELISACFWRFRPIVGFSAGAGGGILWSYKSACIISCRNIVLSSGRRLNFWDLRGKCIGVVSSCFSSVTWLIIIDFSFGDTLNLFKRSTCSFGFLITFCMLLFFLDGNWGIDHSCKGICFDLILFLELLSFLRWLTRCRTWFIRTISIFSLVWWVNFDFLIGASFMFNIFVGLIANYWFSFLFLDNFDLFPLNRLFHRHRHINKVTLSIKVLFFLKLILLNLMFFFIID